MATSHTEPLVPGAPLHDNVDQQDRSRLLSDFNQYLQAHSDVRTAFPGICRRLNRVLPHQSAGIALYDQGSGELRLFAQQVATGITALPAGFTLPLDGTPAGEAYRLRRPILVEDLRSPQFTCETTRELLRREGRSGCWAPLRTANNVFGTVWISSAKPGAYRTEDTFLLSEVAGHIAVALAHQLALQQLQELQQRLDTQMRTTALSLYEIGDMHGFGVVQWEEGGRLSHGNDTYLRLVGRTRGDMERGLRFSDVTAPEHTTLHQHAERELHEHGLCKPFEDEILHPDGKRVPVLVTAGARGQCLPPWVAVVTDLRERQTFSHSRAAAATDPATQDKELLAARSPAMYKILRDLDKVAPTTTTMLLLGETGTGKDVLAHAICQMSPRRYHPFIKVNCSAIPAGLLESELFGHEKGAYTGAQGRKIGRLELAHHGTLFLDEVGDVPLELQPKLLRVLQEREFERLGGTQTIKVDVRLIAATNRDLAQMTASNLFRRDLFYRLNVFPVHVPPLRERPESIAVLVELFVQKFAKRMSRPSLTVPPATLAALERWCWPGNIRELENLIERAVILSPGPELRVNLDELRIETPTSTEPAQTLLDVEREHIRHILHDTNGVIGGKHGAASRLGLKRTTLQSKMKKLEIPRY